MLLQALLTYCTNQARRDENEPCTCGLDLALSPSQKEKP
jgi:hypothetical protein